ncbi:hypothetical protein [Halobacterium wangiae]|uniref:hypothetical protein n=1 Tax=Halobacterium wangiae TaxID=2902623 RepID=UPI001E34E5D8|nr:hypothetical protein [Halobacterium wangiae]
MVDIESVTVGGVPVLSGFLNGVLAYVTGFVASVALYAVVGTSVFTRWTFSGLSPGAEFGFVFYGAHLVPITNGSATLNYATQAANSGELFVLLVVVLLVGTGYSLAAADAVPADTRTKVLAGASLAAGYLPLVVFGGFYFTGTTDGVALSLSFPHVVVLSGVLFPVCLGAVGGYVASQST